MATPTTNRICMGNTTNQYMLDGITDISAVYSIRRQKRSHTVAFRAYDNTASETDIGFIGENLNEAGLLQWLNRNLVASIPLGVDSNANGVSDGWTKSSGVGITATHSIDNFSQKIEITASTTTNKASIIKASNNCVEGNSVSFPITLKVLGNVKARISVDWFNGAAYLTTSAITFKTDANYTTYTLTATAPATATKYDIVCEVFPNSIGNTGSAWFKDASIAISNQSAYIAKLYDPSGNNNHAIQTTAANMPRIVNQGIIDRDFDATKCNALYPTFASASGVNLISNGGFNTNVNGWSANSGSLAWSSNNGGTVITSPFAGQSTLLQILRQICNTESGLTPVVGKRYYFRCKTKCTNAGSITPTGFRFYFYDGTNSIYTTTIAYTGLNNDHIVEGIVTAPITSGTYWCIIQCLFTGTTNATESFESDQVVCVDVTDLGRACIQAILASDTHFVVADADSLDLTDKSSISLVHNPNSAGESSAGRVLEKASAYSLITQSNLSFATLGFSTSNSDIDVYALSRQSINSVLHNDIDNTCKFYSNGTLKTTTGANTLASNSNNLYILNQSGWARQYDGKLSELIIFKKTLSDTERTKIEANQKKYYGIV